MCLALARTYWQNGKPDLTADYVSLAHQRGGHSYAMAKLLNEMIPYYQRRQKTEQAAKLTAILKRLRPSITAPGPVQADYWHPEAVNTAHALHTGAFFSVQTE